MPDRIPAIKVLLLPKDTNALGTIFGGIILAEIDLAAAIEAHKHHPDKIVTVAMDKVEFKQAVHVGDLVSFYTDVERIGTTSVTIRVTVWAERRKPPFETVPVTEALVTMVAVDERHRKVAIHR